jgi:hypothetical protein
MILHISPYVYLIWLGYSTATLFPDSSSACYCIDPSIFRSPHPPFLVLSVCLKVISIDSIYLVLLYTYTSSSSPTQTHLPEYHTVESISFLSELFFLPPPAWPTRRLYLFGFEKQMGAGVKKDRADSLMQSADETRLHCVLPLCDGSSGGAGAGPLLSLTTVGPPVPCVFDYISSLECVC